MPNASAERERWDGASLNCEAALHVFGADEAYPVSEVAPSRPSPETLHQMVLLMVERVQDCMHSRYRVLAKPRAGLRNMACITDT